MCKCRCEKIVTDYDADTVISRSFERLHEIDSEKTCEMLTIEKNGKQAGTNVLIWLFVSTIQGEFASMDNNTTRYECKEE